jgi:hypothetical protein
MTDPMTLDQFWDHVTEVQADSRAKGEVTLYFQHQTLTPGIVRATWENVPLYQIPKPGTELSLAGFGYEGTDGIWEVVSTEMHASGTGVTVTMKDRADWDADAPTGQAR